MPRPAKPRHYPQDLPEDACPQGLHPAHWERLRALPRFATYHVRDHVAETPFLRKTLRNIEFENLVLYGEERPPLYGHLRNVNRKATFSGATLIGVWFTNCDLTEASFSQTTLINCGFQDCTLTGATFANASMRQVQFIGCEALQARFHNISGTRQHPEILPDYDPRYNIYLRTCDLRHSRWHSTYIRSTLLDRCDLSNSDFNRSNWNDVRLDRCTLSGTLLECMDVKQSALIACTVDNLSLYHTYLNGLEITGTHLPDNTPASCYLLSQSDTFNLSSGPTREPYPEGQFLNSTSKQYKNNRTNTTYYRRKAQQSNQV